MRIATIGINYPQTRLVLDGKVDGVEYVSYQNYWNPFLKKVFHTYEIYKPFMQRVDGYHVINTVMLTDKPWCCTFETLVPRGRQLRYVTHHDTFDVEKGWYMEWLLKIFAKDNCKRLIAFSECNLKLQKQLYALFPEREQTLTNKTCQINVPQPLLSDHPKESVNEKVRFFFVGNDFVRKGCQEIIRALHQLRKKRNDFELVMITKTQNVKNYAFNDFQDTKGEIAETLSIVENSKEWLTLYPHLPFSQVKELMMSCDVGLLPTWAESYGYSVLEMQSAGLPVVTTNIRALPETNQKGWIVKLPVNYSGELGLKSREHKEEVRQLMIQGLYEVFDSILDDKQSIVNRSVASYEFIKEHHAPAAYTKKMAEIYNTFKS